MKSTTASTSPKFKASYAVQPPQSVRWGFHATPYKQLFIGMTDEGEVCRLEFAKNRDAATILTACQKEWPQTTFVRDQAASAKIFKQFIAGQGVVKIHMTGTRFQQAVWQEMLKIPRGKVLSYAEVAQRIKNPKAVRAVGTACGANPVAIIVPCHRIVGSNGGLGGFGGGLDMKRALLEKEGVLGPMNKLAKAIQDDPV